MFLQNFFGTCSGYPVEANYLNYVRDLKLYSPTNRHIREHHDEMVTAFFEITGMERMDLEAKVSQGYSRGDVVPSGEPEVFRLTGGIAKPSAKFMYELKVVRTRRRGYYVTQKYRSSEDVYRTFRSRYTKADREEFLVLLLDNKNTLLGFNVVSVGSLTAALVHPREVYKPAILANAAAVIFAHNHPSGDPAPSPEDLEITKRLKETGDVLGIRVLDHVVLGDGRYFSFSDRGLL